MATDFLHGEGVMAAILSVIESNAPAAWFTDGEAEELRLCTIGSLQEYAIRDITNGARQPSIIDECPAILVRPLGTTPDSGYSGSGGMRGTDEQYRVIMARTFAQTLDDSGDETTVAHGKARYGKLLCAALFGTGRLGSPTLTTTDSSADIIRVDFVSADYSDETDDARDIAIVPAQVWAIALDCSVKISTV